MSAGGQVTRCKDGEYGADYFGEVWAELHAIPIKKFKADWWGLGRKAGPVRNQQMADYADALIAIWDGESRGTRDMIERATKKGLLVFVYNTKKGEYPYPSLGRVWG